MGDMRPVFSGPKDDKYLDARSDYLACKSLQLNNFGIWGVESGYESIYQIDSFTKSNDVSISDTNSNIHSDFKLFVQGVAKYHRALNLSARYKKDISQRANITDFAALKRVTTNSNAQFFMDQISEEVRKEINSDHPNITDVEKQKIFEAISSSNDISAFNQAYKQMESANPLLSSLNRAYKKINDTTKKNYYNFVFNIEGDVIKGVNVENAIKIFPVTPLQEYYKNSYDTSTTGYFGPYNARNFDYDKSKLLKCELELAPEDKLSEIAAESADPLMTGMYGRVNGELVFGEAH